MNTFHPKIGRSPKTQRNSLNLPIGDYLYYLKKGSDATKEEFDNFEESSEIIKLDYLVDITIQTILLKR